MNARNKPLPKNNLWGLTDGFILASGSPQRLRLLEAAGFSPRAICIFTDIKVKNFYNKRSRLKEKILASDAPDKEWFVSKM